MTNPFFFGYGSLVNSQTHTYPRAAIATARGWQRAWVSTKSRRFSYLTAQPSPKTEIHGLIAAVPNADWAALDLREEAYDRLDATRSVSHQQANVGAIAIYSVPQANQEQPAQAHPILLSYLDVVLQGYLREFGRDGISHFMDTTTGWDGGVFDDRAQPVYPRHQRLTLEEQSLVDQTLQNAGVRILRELPRS